MQRSRSVNDNENRYTSIPADGGGGTSWADRLLLEPILDDGRRTLTTNAPPTSPSTGDRYIVGVGATGAWASKIGNLVTWNGAAWDTVVPSVNYGSIVYSAKRDEYLLHTYTIGSTIAPTLSPEVLSYADDPLEFWIPMGLGDTFYMAEKGTVLSVTADSASWSTTMYARYVVKSGDTSFSAFANYIATYIADMLTHAGQWVFQQAKEGDQVYSSGDNNFYYFNGTTWVVQSGSGIAALFAAEGRTGSGAAPTMTLTASASNTFAKIAFPYSAVLDLAVCPASFFMDGADEFEAPRTGHYTVGFSAFYLERISGVVDQTLTFVVRVNGTTIPSGTFVIPNLDNYEGEGFKCILKLNAGDLVTLEWKAEGADWAEDVVVHNGPNMFVYTIDAAGNESPLGPLNDHTDTNFPTPADGDTIVWDAATSKWINAAGPAPGPHTLGSHSDTAFSSLAVNDVPKWDGSQWVNGAVAAGPHTIIGSSHSDTQILGSLANNHVLMYETGSNKWRNKPIPIPDLDSLTNVSASGKAVGDFLWWTGSSWGNRAIRLDDLFDVVSAAPTTGYVLTWNGSQWAPQPVSAPASTPNFAGASFYWSSGWQAFSTAANCSSGGPNQIYVVAGIAGKWELTVSGNAGGGTPLYFQTNFITVQTVLISPYVNTISYIAPLTAGGNMAIAGFSQLFTATFKWLGV